MEHRSSDYRRLAALASSAALACAVSAAIAGPVTADIEEQAQEAWRVAIAHTPVPEQACFHAAYPDTKWTKVACTTAADIPYLPTRAAIGNTVGNGADYAAQVTGLISSSIGTFPVVTGVKAERGGAPNTYSIQLNSNFMNTAVCAGHTGCQSWEQFVYSTTQQQAFMQYWLINYGKCPAGWNTFSPDCYKNSAAVNVPKQVISQLSHLKMSASAVVNGIDTLVFTTATQAYSTSGPDSVVDLATGWNAVEFNIIGDGGGSKASFNKGSSLTVNIGVTDGSTAAPTCAVNAGTTGETNNLNLKSCTATGGTTPGIQFVESN